MNYVSSANLSPIDLLQLGSQKSHQILDQELYLLRVVLKHEVIHSVIFLEKFLGWKKNTENLVVKLRGLDEGQIGLVLVSLQVEHFD